MPCFAAMTSLTLLWLPILLSAAIVFIASFVIHMAIPWHRSDYHRMPEEDKVMDALRPFAIPPGDYMVPRPSNMKDMRTPEFADKIKNGPVMVVTVMPNGQMGVGRNMVLWFINLLVVGFLTAYVAGRALPVGAPYLHVFRFAGATAFIAYSVALWQLSIWYRRSWGTTIRYTLDGLIFACLTAGVFGWLWPR